MPLSTDHPRAPRTGGPLPYPPGPAPSRPVPHPAPAVASPAGPVGYVPVPQPGSDPVLDELLDERVLYLGGVLDDEAADRVCARLLLLAARESRPDITLYLNVSGGSAAAALAVHDTMRLIRPDIATYAVGLAASVGGFLLAAGTPGKRHALAHARVRLCRPASGAGGLSRDVTMRAGVTAGLRREIAELTARYTGQPAATVADDTEADRWLTAQQARDYGIVDRVIEQEGPPGVAPGTGR